MQYIATFLHIFFLFSGALPNYMNDITKPKMYYITKKVMHLLLVWFDKSKQGYKNIYITYMYVLQCL